MATGSCGAATHGSSVLIVGAGLFGASTAYWLSKEHPHLHITVVDRTPFPPRHAASTDINKVVREDYTVAFYMDLASEALHAWKTWPELKDYFHPTGWVNLNANGSDLAPRIRQNFVARGRDSTSDLTLAQVRSQFGGLFRDSELSDCDSAYWNPDAGWADAGAAVARLMQLAVDRGVEYVCADVLELHHSPERGGVDRVMTSASAFSADKVLLCSGAWTSAIMSPLEDSLAISPPDRIEAQVKAAGVCVAHYALSDDEYQLLHQNMPVTIFGHNGDAQPPPAESRLLKMTNSRAVLNTVTTASGARISVPPDRPQDQVSQKLKDETWEVITGRLMPQFTQRPVDQWRLCWDAITPTQDHLITKHPDPRLSNLYIAVGGSFHSWKFLPCIGKYVTKVLHDESNGAEKDQHWAWKSGGSVGRGASVPLAASDPCACLTDLNPDMKRRTLPVTWPTWTINPGDVCLGADLVYASA